MNLAALLREAYRESTNEEALTEVALIAGLRSENRALRRHIGLPVDDSDDEGGGGGGNDGGGNTTSQHDNSNQVGGGDGNSAAGVVVVRLPTLKLRSQLVSSIRFDSILAAGVLEPVVSLRA